MEATLKMQEKLKNFKLKIQKILGIKISDRETIELFKKYGSCDVDSAVNRDLATTKVIHKAFTEKLNIHDSSLDCSKFTLEQLFTVLNDRISIKTGSSLGDYRVKKAYQIFSGGRDTLLSRESLKGIFLSRLSLSVPDHLIDKIFEFMDPFRSGMINSKRLVTTIIKSSYSASDASLQIDDNVLNNSDKISEPYATYDAKFLHLNPPQPSAVETKRAVHTVEEIERAICDQVVQRTGKGTTLIQTLIKCFGDTRNKVDKNVGITRDQVRYSLWTRFQMHVTDEEIDLLFIKYDKQKRGLIPLHAFVEGVIKNHAMSKALMENVEVEGSYADDPYHDNTIDELLTIIKKAIMENMNRESRAPHYILHSSSRMRIDQYKDFIIHKLRIPNHFIDKVMKLTLSHYYVDGLIDLRKMLYDTMAFSKDGKLALNARHRSNAIIESNELPCSIRAIKLDPEKVEEMLVLKINERAKNNNPLSTLHKLFKDGGQTTKTVNKGAMQSLFSRFDILISQQDFDEFYSRHDRGDGLVDVRQFLKKLIPAPNYAENPLAPKSVDEISRQTNLAQELAMLTGRKREVSSINGVTDIRFVPVKTEENNLPSFYDRAVITPKENYTRPVIKNNFFENLKPEIDLKDYYLRDLSTPGTSVSESTNYDSYMKDTQYNTLNSDKEYQFIDKHYDLTPQEIDTAIKQYKDKMTSNNISNVSNNQSNFNNNPTRAEVKPSDYNFISNRPSTASPRAKSFQTKVLNNTNNDTKYNIQKQPPTKNDAPSTTMHSPRRPNTAPLAPSKSHQNSPRSPRSVYNGSINGGQNGKSKPVIDPYNRVLMQRYRVARKNTTTNHEEYGLFIKNLNKVLNIKKSKMGATGFVG